MLIYLLTYLLSYLLAVTYYYDTNIYILTLKITLGKVLKKSAFKDYMGEQLSANANNRVSLNIEID